LLNSSNQTVQNGKLYDITILKPTKSSGSLNLNNDAHNLIIDWDLV